MKVKMFGVMAVCIALTGCGKEPVNYSANAINELKAGKASYEVFQEDTISEIRESNGDAVGKIVDKYVSSIELVQTEVVENTAVYTCSVLNVSDVLANIVSSSAFETEKSKWELTGDMTGFEDSVYELALSEMDSCERATVRVEGYCSQDLLVTSRDLMQPLTQMLSTEILTEDVDATADAIVQVGTGDFVTKVGKNRILISNVVVKDSSEASLQDVTEPGVYVTFDVTNLGTKKVVVESAFFGVTQDNQKVEKTASIFGLKNKAAVKAGKTVSMTDFVSTEKDDMLVWDSETCGAHFYKWR